MEKFFWVDYLGFYIECKYSGISLIWPVSYMIACDRSQSEKCDRRECLFFPRPRLDPSWFKSDTWSPMLRDSNAGGRWWDGYWSEWDSTEIQRRLDPRPIWSSPPPALIWPPAQHHLPPQLLNPPPGPSFYPAFRLLFKAFKILVERY